MFFRGRGGPVAVASSVRNTGGGEAGGGGDPSHAPALPWPLEPRAVLRPPRDCGPGSHHAFPGGQTWARAPVHNRDPPRLRGKAAGAPDAPCPLSGLPSPTPPGTTVAVGGPLGPFQRRPPGGGRRCIVRLPGQSQLLCTLGGGAKRGSGLRPLCGGSMPMPNHLGRPPSLCSLPALNLIGMDTDAPTAHTRERPLPSQVSIVPKPFFFALWYAHATIPMASPPPTRSSPASAPPFPPPPSPLPLRERPPP